MMDSKQHEYSRIKQRKKERKKGKEKERKLIVTETRLWLSEAGIEGWEKWVKGGSQK